MKIIEVGTGYTSIPAKMGAATEIVIEELAKVFDKNNINYEIFDIKDENRQDTNLKIKEIYIPKFFRKKDVSLGLLHKLKRVIYSVKLAYALKKEIKKSKEEIVIHFHNQYNMFFFSKLVPKKIKRKSKICYTVHSYIWNAEWEKIETSIKKRYFQEVDCVKKADKVFVLNDKTKEHFIKQLKINEGKIVKIKNGVNTEIYKPRMNESENINFFQSGSVCERKNQLTAIQTLKNLMKENKKVRYIYAGGIIEEAYQEKIQQYVEKNNIENQVEYVGEIAPGENLAKYYNNSIAFIFPSVLESFGLVIIEAMASGIPVIMYGKTEITEFEDLKDLIFVYKDQESFEKILRDKIFNEKERENIVKKARKIIEEKYSWDVVAQKYLKEL